MKYFVSIFWVLVSLNSYSEAFKKQGKISDILLRTDSEHYAIFYVSGFNTAGSCNTFREHVINVIPKDDLAEARYSMLLGLHLAGKDVSVMVSDNKKASDGSCIIQDLRINSNF